MKKVASITFLGIIAILVLDTAGSFLSRTLLFDYTMLSPVSFIVYASTAFFSSRKTSKLVTGVLVGGILGAFDATAGWYISYSLGANTGVDVATYSASLILSTSLFVIITSMIIGLLGGFIAIKTKK